MPMPDTAFTNRLNEQIGNEFAASQQYVAMAVHYDAQTLPQLAGFFYRQAVEERNHAMIMVQHLLDVGETPTIPEVPAPGREFGDVVEPVRQALEQERKVSEQIYQLMRGAREAHDYTSEQFVLWFVKEQVEEVATMSSLLDVAERCRDDVMELEEYVARELGGRDDDPSTPPAAGGAL
jgi:bacterioferritin B